MGEAAPVVYLLYGEDEFAIAQFVSEMEARLGDPTTAMMNVTHLDGRSYNPDELLSVASVMPFLATRRLAKQRALQGRLHEARDLHEQALQLAADHDGHYLPLAGISLIELGEIWREWNDLEKAAGLLDAGIKLVSQWAEIGALRGYISLAYVRQAQDDGLAARAAMSEAQHAYAVGRFSLTDVLAVRRDWAAWEAELLDALVRHHTAAADLTALLGEAPFPRVFTLEVSR